MTTPAVETRPDPKSRGASAGGASEDPARSMSNWNKFTPHCVNLRTGSLPTLSDLFAFWDYNVSLHFRRQFTLIIDDRTFEGVNAEMNAPIVDLAIGLGCSYLHVKGVQKPERLAKVISYKKAYLKQRLTQKNEVSLKIEQDIQLS